MADFAQYETSIMIPNTQYIRINDKVRTVAGRKSWSYRDNDIVFREIYPAQTFEKILNAYPFVLAVHGMTSQASGKWRTMGVPSPVHGEHIWGRAEMKGNVYSPWIYVTAKKDPREAARSCAEEVLKAFCGLQVKEMLDFFGDVIECTPRYQIEMILNKAAQRYLERSL